MTTPIDAAAAQAAHQTLFQRAYVPAFMQKLAEAGVTPQDAQEQQLLLQMGLTLRQQHVAAGQGARNRLLSKAASSLGLSGAAAAQPGLDARVKEAAQIMANDPAIAAAALTLHAAYNS